MNANIDNAEKGKKKLRVVLTGSGIRDDVNRAMNEVIPLINDQAELILVDKNGKEDFSTIDADLIIMFGGDGSLINVAGRLKGNQVPVLGVNFGKFGFLAEYEFLEFLSDLNTILQGKFKISERMMHKVAVNREGMSIFESYALNDSVISRSHFSRIIKVSLEVNNQHCTRYHVDGVIISTPSGSTAHSLGAGGPIIHPTMDATIITPICPHTMSMRPLVLPGEFPIKLTLIEKNDTVALTIDGQNMQELKVGDIVSIKSAVEKMLLVVSGRRTFFDRLQKKLNWSGHSNIQ